MPETQKKISPEHAHTFTQSHSLRPYQNDQLTDYIANSLSFPVFQPLSSDRLVWCELSFSPHQLNWVNNEIPKYINHQPTN